MRLRLTVAAALEFPDGSMTASGLRREAAHGRLQIWRIAAKDYTTMAALKVMRGKCVRSSRHDLRLRPARKGRRATWVIKDQEREISTALALALESAQKLKSRLLNISPAPDNPSSATVIPLKSS